jgi:endonuclease/exonuclease/phosphatase family metal-dependent hydrolase
VRLTVVTYNVYNHTDFERRLPAIVETLRRADADLACLQEVPPGSGMTDEIAAACGYEHSSECVFRRPDDGWSEALAVLSRFPVLEREPVELRPGVPNCFRLLLDGPGSEVSVYNTHLHPRDSELRQREAAIIMERMAREISTPAVLCGDFNAVPGGRTMSVVWSHLVSAFEHAQGRHPETTFPTPLRPPAERTPGFSERREAAPVDDEAEARAAIDYVLVRPGQFRAVEATVIGAQLDAVWPSDHYGLRVVLESA